MTKKIVRFLEEVRKNFKVGTPTHCNNDKIRLEFGIQIIKGCKNCQ